MNILLELLAWYQSKGDDYRQITLFTTAVDDFLLQRANKKIDFKCESLAHIKENIVAILTLMGDPNLKTKKDVSEIDNVAMEIYEYLSKNGI